MQAVQYVALQFKLLGHAEVRDVAAVNNKVHVAACIDGAHGVLRFVIPALRVAYQHKVHLVAPLA